MNYSNKNNLFVSAVGTIFILLFFPLSVGATKMDIVPSSAALPVGQTLRVDITVSTEGESFNALGATLEFPSKLLEFQSIRDGGSLVNFWVDSPYLSTDDSLTFSGVTPGGYSEAQGLVVSFVFTTKAEGKIVLKLSGIEVLRNDGAGTVIPVAESTASITIAASAPNSAVVVPIDATSPEPFSISVARDPAVFDGKWFIVFATQDKDAGIHHYEVAEQRGPLIAIDENDQRLSWREVSSPYMIQDQSLKSSIYVRAIDRAGNDRVASTVPQTPLAWYEYYRFYGIVVGIIVALAIVITLWRVLRKK